MKCLSRDGSLGGLSRGYSMKDEVEKQRETLSPVLSI